MPKNETVKPNSAGTPDSTSWFTKRKQRVALAAAAAVATGAAVAACGSEIGGTLNTGKYSINTTYLVVSNSGGQILVTDASSDGMLQDNRFGWNNTTVAQATLAGMATNTITPLLKEQVNTICAGNNCPSGTVLTTRNASDQWDVWSGIKVGQNVPEGKVVPQGHDYYKVACMLTKSQVEKLNDATSLGNDNSVSAGVLKADGCDVTGVKAETFVYPTAAKDWIGWDMMAQDLHYQSGVSVTAFENQYDLPFTPGQTPDSSKVALVDWVQAQS